MRTLYRVVTAFAALVCAASCSGLGGIAAFRGTPATGPSLVRSNALTFRVFTAGQTPGFPADARVVDIAPGPGETMWFTDFTTHAVRRPAIGRIASDGTFTEFSNGLRGDARPYSIVAGPDGNMWFSDWRGVALGKITPQGAITEYVAGGYPHRNAKGIAFGPGAEPWVLADDESGSNPPLLAHLTPKGTLEAQVLPAGMDAEVGAALASDAAGNLWFVALTEHTRRGVLVERPARLARFFRTPLNMAAAFLPCCANVAPKAIATGGNGNPWFTTLYLIFKNSPHKYIGTLKAGRGMLFQLRRGKLPYVVYPSGLAAAADGFWITGSESNADAGALWHFDGRSGQAVFPLPHAPLAVAVDAGGNPWFTTKFAFQPSRIVEVLTH